MNKTPQ